MGFGIGKSRVIPGRRQKRLYARLRRAMAVSPGIHNHCCGRSHAGRATSRILWLWIPGSVLSDGPGMTETSLRILIIGAGIGGLTAALALLRDGHEVEVYEQAPALGELGAGVQI